MSCPIFRTPHLASSSMQLHPEAVPELRYIPPRNPITEKDPSAGEAWLHDIEILKDERVIYWSRGCAPD